MSEKIIKILLLILLAAGVVSYLYYLNPQPVTVSLGGTKPFEVPLAIALIFTFGSGALSIAFFLLLFGLKIRFQNWRAQRQAATERHHQQLHQSARDKLALGDFAAARNIFGKIISRDPEDLSARVSLARSYQKENRLREALSVLDDARANQKKSIDLLMLAAELNQGMGNNTAAHDNAALVLTLAPGNPFALRLLVQSASGLARFNEAIEYQKELIKSASGEKLAQEQQALAHLELELAKQQNLGNRAGLRKEVEAVLRRHRDFLPALRLLAEIALEENATEEAGRYLIRIFLLSGDTGCLEELALAWLKLNNPQKALQALHTVLEQRSVEPWIILRARLVLCELLLQLEMVDEARQELELLGTPASKDAHCKLPSQLLWAHLRQKQGRPEEALDMLLSVIEQLIQGQEVICRGLARQLKRPEPACTPSPDYSLQNEITPPRLT